MNFLILTCQSTTFFFIWELFLNILQHFSYQSSHILETKHQLFDKITYEKSKSYGIKKSWLRISRQVFSYFQQMIFLYYNFLPKLWIYSGALIKNNQNSFFFEIQQSLIFLIIFSVYSFILMLPWDLYGTFVVEERFGFNNQSLNFYFWDTIKSFLFQTILIVILLPPLLYIIHSGGNYFYFHVWAFFFLFSLFFITIYPNFIAPLFDTFTLLKDGTLKTKIEKMSEIFKFPLSQIYVVDSSKRSSHSNAYIYGFWKSKRIVLFDTLLPEYSSQKSKSDLLKNQKTCTEEEIVSILAHELGHWKYGHTLKLFFITQINIFLFFWAYKMLMNYHQIYESFGFYETQPILIGLWIIIEYLFSPINKIMGYLMTRLSRKHEFEADSLAKDVGYGKTLQSALIKIQMENLSDINPHPLYSSFYFSHPPILERLAALDDRQKNE